MSERFGSEPGPITHDPADPDPWLALTLDRGLPIDDEAKALLIANGRSRSRQFLLAFVRPFARLAIILVQVIRTILPNRVASSWLLHHSIAWGMKRLLRPEANILILRHFHLGAEILAFIADNATPGYRPELKPMRPGNIDAVKDDLFLHHDLNIFNFLILLNQEMERRGVMPEKRETLDFSAISDTPPAITVPPQGRLNVIDLETAIECYTPLYGLLLSDGDFWRAANSLQLDETVALYVARLFGDEGKLALVNNRHPLLPLPTWSAGYRLMLHGLATETLHGLLRQEKARQLAQKGI